jgi:hypothetical protein
MFIYVVHACLQDQTQEAVPEAVASETSTDEPATSGPNSLEATLEEIIDLQSDEECAYDELDDDAQGEGVSHNAETAASNTSAACEVHSDPATSGHTSLEAALEEIINLQSDEECAHDELDDDAHGEGVSHNAETAASNTSAACEVHSDTLSDAASHPADGVPTEATMTECIEIDDNDHDNVDNQATSESSIGAHPFAERLDTTMSTTITTASAATMEAARLLVQARKALVDVAKAEEAAALDELAYALADASHTELQGFEIIDSDDETGQMIDFSFGDTAASPAAVPDASVPADAATTTFSQQHLHTASAELEPCKSTDAPVGECISDESDDDSDCAEVAHKAVDASMEAAAAECSDIDTAHGADAVHSDACGCDSDSDMTVAAEITSDTGESLKAYMVYRKLPSSRQFPHVGHTEAETCDDAGDQEALIEPAHHQGRQLLFAIDHHYIARLVFNLNISKQLQLPG